MTHKEWLDNEYAQWVKALQESTVHNFKEHPVVKRMLGEVIWKLHASDAGEAFYSKWHLINHIDNIGYNKETIAKDEHWSGGTLLRYVYYAQQILKRNPSSICEIGGGVGQFYAILRALGWKGSYYIMDLTAVQEFQYKYLAEVSRQTGLQLHLTRNSPEMLISFYALGEFDDETKESYRELIESVQRGYIVWNPHSGANGKTDLFKSHNFTEMPGIEPGITIIEW